MLGKTLELAGDLHSKLPCWNKHQALNLAGVRLDPLQHWQRIGQSLARPGLGLANQVSTLQERCYRFHLYRERFVETHLPDSLEEARVQSECFETLSQFVHSIRVPNKRSCS